MKTRTATITFSLVFAIPFLSVGIFTGYLALQMLLGWQQARNWEPVPASILATDLKTNRGKKSTSYEVTARYRYEYQGRSYEASRVGFTGGADNIGSWHQDWYDSLLHAKQEGWPLQAWVNPRQPGQAVIDRNIRWGQLLFLLPFVTLFSAVGLGAFWVCGKALRTPAEKFDAVDPNPERIVSNGKAAVRGAWLFAVFWNLLAFPVAALVLSDAQARQGPALLVLLFPLVGLFLLWLALRATLDLRRFGELSLTLSPPQPVVGAPFTGTIQFEKFSEPGAEYALTLVCERVISGGKSSNTRHEILWQERQPAHRLGDSLRFQFAPPAGLPPSEPLTSVYKRWQLRIASADQKMKREFDVTLGAA